MKKAAIITITGGLNFGNRLQNYAVQEIINKYGYESLTVVNNSGQENRIMFHIKTFLKKYFFKKKYGDYFNRKKYFDTFNKKYIKFTKFYLTNSKVKKNIEKDFDLFVCGSDQIWNLDYLENGLINFLGFVSEKKKIAFAASYGISDIPSTYNSNVKKWLKELDFISVREEAGVKITQKLTGRKDVEVMPDPTLLLSEDDWDKLISNPKDIPQKKFVLLYFLGDISQESLNKIYTYAENNDLEIVDIMDKKSPYHYIGPSEFLFFEKNAQAIFTDSYHACIFSLIFKKPFVVFDRIENNVAKMSSRIDTLLNRFKFNKQKYNDSNNVLEVILLMDYKNTDIIFEDIKNNADVFFKKSLYEER